MFKSIKDWPEYRDWAKTIWFTKESEADNSERLLLIAVLGISGETSEIATELQSKDYQNLLKELGDVFYYLTILCARFKLDLSAIGFETTGLPDPEKEYLELVKATGNLSEFFKKYIRGDQDKIQELKDADQGKSVVMKQKLSRIALYLVRLSDALGLNIQDVMKANKEKLVSRKERGVLRGDGNDR